MNKIKDLWANHEKEITAVSTLYELVDKISFDGITFTQLNTAKDEAIKNWGLIAR